MTKLKHTKVFKLAILLVAVLMMHSEVYSESKSSWYEVSFDQFANSNNAFDALQLDCPENISVFTEDNSCSAKIESGLNVNFVGVVFFTDSNFTCDKRKI